MFDLSQMPVCQFFLRGKCSNDNCPYSHVNVSKKAKVCEDFLKGFCARGQQVSMPNFVGEKPFLTYKLTERKKALVLIFWFNGGAVFVSIFW